MIQIKNRYTQEVILEFESLINADLSGFDLRDSDLSCASLKNADLRDSDLSGSDLRGANLSGASLKNADLINSYLRNADLSGSDLKGSYLKNASLKNADLEGASNYYSFVAYDTSKRLVHCVKHDSTWMIKAGCFWGTLEELEIKVLDTHKSSVYLANIEILKTI